MSLKVSIPKPANRDFGRRLYLSDKGYVEQMRQTTDRAKLNEQEFPLSEFKKPYATDSYEEMEYRYSPTDGKGLQIDLPTVTRIDREIEEGQQPVTTTRTGESSLSWRIEPPDEADVSKDYNIEVNTGVKETVQITAGKVTKHQKTFRTPVFSLVKASADAKGFDLEVLVKVNTTHDPYIRVHYQYRWYKWDDAWLKSLYQRGLIIAEATMQAKLITKDSAAGTYEVRVEDGKTRLREKVKISDIPQHLFVVIVYDSEGNELGYVPLDHKNFTLLGDKIYTYSDLYIPPVSTTGAYALRSNDGDLNYIFSHAKPSEGDTRYLAIYEYDPSTGDAGAFIGYIEGPTANDQITYYAPWNLAYSNTDYVMIYEFNDYYNMPQGRKIYRRTESGTALIATLNLGEGGALWNCLTLENGDYIVRYKTIVDASSKYQFKFEARLSGELYEKELELSEGYDGQYLLGSIGGVDCYFRGMNIFHSTIYKRDDEEA